MTDIRIIQADLALAGAVEAALPEFARKRTVDQYLARFQGRPHLCLVALVDGRAAAYKLGYRLDEGVFYSWLGGVLPPWRRLGLAQRLLDAQESWARRHGYQRIEVKSTPEFPTMLAFLAKNGYRSQGGPGRKLLFVKPLAR
ncbi:GNAT family N-acetyltransferase [Gallaecimonas sp. GXIMD4217]|uniref:GNAT family N-acetyltransferase n=1 Tax=Gallaecimonas sp. GXIMD4217 TaxID=3131927 RepID=UPI00311AF323